MAGTFSFLEKGLLFFTSSEPLINLMCLYSTASKNKQTNTQTKEQEQNKQTYKIDK